jgi:hypothetical protein
MKRIFFNENRLGIQGVDVNENDKIVTIHPEITIFLKGKIIYHAELGDNLIIKGEKNDTIQTIFQVNGIIHL